MQHNKNTKYIFTIITLLYKQNTEKKNIMINGFPFKHKCIAQIKYLIDKLIYCEMIFENLECVCTHQMQDSRFFFSFLSNHM